MGLSDNTTVFTKDIAASGASFDRLESTAAMSNVSSSRVTAATVWATSTVSSPAVNVQGGANFSGVTADFRTNSVIPSMVTYAGGATISGLTIGQWGFVQNASGFSIVFSSGKTAYFFGGSTLSAAIV